MNRLFTSAAMAGAISVLGCSGALAGSITGKIVYEGEVPAVLSKPIDTSADPECATHAADNPVMNETLVLGEGQTLANILVKVTKGLPEKTWDVPAEPATMTQEGCRYAPHVTVVRLGQTLYVKNPDGIFHNVNCAPKKNKPQNRAMPKNMKILEFVFDQAEEEPFRFKCDVHPWMMAYCAVLTHPFYDVTEKDGVFTIEGLDPGEYEIEAWHERLGVQKATVTVAADKAGEANFTFSKPAPKPAG